MDVELERAAVPGVPPLRWTPGRLLPVSDDRLAQLVSTGHEQAFATLYDRYHQRLYRYCRSILGNENDAQDALQSAFAGAFAALAEGRRDAPVRPWLYRIAHNESVSILRRRRPEVEISEDHIAPAASAAEVAEERSRLALLMADLAELTERQRAALIMRELSGLSHAEIATALTIDLSAAKQTIFEARRSLQEFAEGRAMVCDDVCRAISDGGGRTLRGRRVRAHLRDCRGCAAFAAAIPTRSRDLRAVAPPLAGVAAVSILRRAIASTSTPGGGSGAGVAASTVGRAAGALTIGKALAGAAAVATLAAGASSIVPSAAHPHRFPAPSVRSPASHAVSARRAHLAPDVSAVPAHPAARAADAGRSLTQRARAGRVSARGHGHAVLRGRGRASAQTARTQQERTPSRGQARGRSTTGASQQSQGRATGSSRAATRSSGPRRTAASPRAPATAGTRVKPASARSGGGASRSTIPVSPSALTSHGASASHSSVTALKH